MTFGLQSDESTAVAILDRAADGGIDFLDTSDAYPLGGDLSTRGITEEILGRWLRGKRDRFIVATKCFAPTGPAPFDGGNSRKHIMSAVDASLRRLQTDYIDLYQIHRPDPDTDIDLIQKAWASKRDPLYLPGNFNNRILVDACIPYDKKLAGTFPVVVDVSGDLRGRLRAKFPHIFPPM